MYFPYFLNLSIKVPLKFEKYIKLFGTFEDTIPKCPNIIRKNTPFLASRLYPSPSMELKLLVNHPVYCLVYLELCVMKMLLSTCIFLSIVSLQLCVMLYNEHVVMYMYIS